MSDLPEYITFTQTGSTSWLYEAPDGKARADLQHPLRGRHYTLAYEPADGKRQIFPIEVPKSRNPMNARSSVRDSAAIWAAQGLVAGLEEQRGTRLLFEQRQKDQQQARTFNPKFTNLSTQQVAEEWLSLADEMREDISDNSREGLQLTQDEYSGELVARFATTSPVGLKEVERVRSAEAGRSAGKEWATGITSHELVGEIISHRRLDGTADPTYEAARLDALRIARTMRKNGVTDRFNDWSDGQLLAFLSRPTSPVGLTVEQTTATWAPHVDVADELASRGIIPKEGDRLREAHEAAEQWIERQRPLSPAERDPDYTKLVERAGEPRRAIYADIERAESWEEAQAVEQSTDIAVGDDVYHIQDPLDHGVWTVADIRGDRVQLHDLNQPDRTIWTDKELVNKELTVDDPDVFDQGLQSGDEVVHDVDAFEIAGFRRDHDGEVWAELRGPDGLPHTAPIAELRLSNELQITPYDPDAPAPSKGINEVATDVSERHVEDMTLSELTSKSAELRGVQRELDQRGRATAERYIDANRQLTQRPIAIERSYGFDR